MVEWNPLPAAIWGAPSVDTLSGTHYQLLFEVPHLLTPWVEPTTSCYLRCLICWHLEWNPLPAAIWGAPSVDTLSGTNYQLLFEVPHLLTPWVEPTTSCYLRCPICWHLEWNPLPAAIWGAPSVDTLSGTHYQLLFEVPHLLTPWVEPTTSCYLRCPICWHLEWNPLPAAIWGAPSVDTLSGTHYQLLFEVPHLLTPWVEPTTSCYLRCPICWHLEWNPLPAAIWGAPSVDTLSGTHYQLLFEVPHLLTPWVEPTTSCYLRCPICWHHHC